MKKIKKKDYFILTAGGFFGFLLLLIGSKTPSILDSLPNWLSTIIGLPAMAGLLTSSIILWPICALSNTNICRGLGFDGGPLAWIEWTCLIGGMVIGYALIFWGVYKIYCKIRKK